MGFHTTFHWLTCSPPPSTSCFACYASWFGKSNNNSNNFASIASTSTLSSKWIHTMNESLWLVDRMGRVAQLVMAMDGGPLGGYSVLVFTGWDHGLQDQLTAKVKHNNLRYRLQVNATSCLQRHTHKHLHWHLRSHVKSCWMHSQWRLSTFMFVFDLKIKLGAALISIFGFSNTPTFRLRNMVFKYGRLLAFTNLTVIFFWIHNTMFSFLNMIQPITYRLVTD